MVFFRLVSLLPFFILYRISDLLFIFSFRVFRYRRSVVRSNLKNSFPEKSEHELKEIEKGFYRNFCDIIVEAVKALTISRSAFEKRFTFRNLNIPVDYMDKGTSTIVLAGHLCNWEWVLLACCIASPYQIDAVYKPLASPFFDKLMLKIRTRFGAHPVKMKETFRELKNRRDITRTIAMVADQTPPRSEIKGWFNFLNQDTPFYIGAEKIAYLTEMPVIFVGMKRMKRGHYEIWFEEISSAPYDRKSKGHPVIAAYARALEKAISENPSDWLWSHKRWKHEKRDEEGLRD